ncbi:unnamed protein product [Blepharisma stoltei]|uniref:Uncharacterized protein n=1 Tax=Blepharisma stoltei TaxID=1481888 RepID=A0AAU9JKX4_9CILI|nr:unnamed protein product [Blepharisma stoltei]
MGCGSSTEQNPATLNKPTINPSLTPVEKPKISLSVETQKCQSFFPAKIPAQNISTESQTERESFISAQETQTEVIEYDDKQTGTLEIASEGLEWNETETQTENENPDEDLGNEIKKICINFNIVNEDSKNDEIIGVIETIIQQWKEMGNVHQHLHTRTEPNLMDSIMLKREDPNNVSLSTLISDGKLTPLPGNKVKVVTRQPIVKTKISAESHGRKGPAAKEETVESKINTRNALLKLVKSTSPSPDHILKTRFDEEPKKNMSPFPFLKKRKSIESKPLSVFDPLRFKLQEKVKKPGDKSPKRLSLNEDMLGSLLGGALTPDPSDN